MANCAYCRRYFRSKQDCLDHMNQYHGKELERDQLDAAQSLYKSTHGTIHGACMMCGKETEWNYKTGKPFKMCNDPTCREKLSKIADRNMMRVYGKKTLLNDMTMQEEMQKNRHTYHMYTFSDGGKVGYLSNPELNFLQFCDTIMEFTSNMIQSSPEYFVYHDSKDDKDHIYMPDYYLPDYNLIVEIKDGGKRTNTNPKFVEETKYKVALKDAVMSNQTKYNYIRISGQEYGPFVETLYRITHQEVPTGKSTKKNIVVITESACVDPDDSVDFSQPEKFNTCFLEMVYDRYTNQLKGIGISETNRHDRIYLENMETGYLEETSGNHPIFENSRIFEYEYIGDSDLLTEAMNTIIQQCNLSGQNRILSILENCGIPFHNHQNAEFIHRAIYINKEV